MQYAPRPPLRRRRIVGRVVIAFALALFAGAAVYWFPVWREHVTLYLLQRQCMRHAPAADEVVYDHGPGRADALMSLGGYHHMASSPPAAFLVPQDWRDFYGKLSPPGLKSHGTVFLGRMTTHGGKVYLVAVDLTVESAGNDDVLLMSRVVEPGSLLRRPRLLGGMGTRLLSFGLLDAPVTPGRVDPADPTHLILFGGRVQGWLGDDGSMSLRPDDPGPVAAPNDGPQSRPVTRPAPSSRESPRSSAAQTTAAEAAPTSWSFNFGPVSRIATGSARLRIAGWHGQVLLPVILVGEVGHGQEYLPMAPRNGGPLPCSPTPPAPSSPG